jgi:hypothetical protein
VFVNYNLLFQGADPNAPAIVVPAIVIPAAAAVAQGQGRGQVVQQVSKFKHNMSITWLVFFVAP